MMKKITLVISLLLLILFLFVGCEKKSTDWVEIEMPGAPRGVAVFSYKIANINKEGGNHIVQVWEKKIIKSDKLKKLEILILEAIMPQNSGKSTEGIDKLSEIRGLAEWDCKKHMSRRLSQEWYDSDGKLLYSLNITEKYHMYDWKSWPPDSPIRRAAEKTWCNE